MKNKEIPIAKPAIIPRIKPISKSESWILFGVSNCSLFEAIIAVLSISGIFEELVDSATIEFDGIIFSGITISDERFVNFALSVIGSVVEFPPNKVECVNNEYVPV